jgi:anti-anti-sigma factor
VRKDQLPDGRGAMIATHSDGGGLGVSEISVGGQRFVRLSGELDIATREVVRRACLEGNALTVVVDMTDLTFIDCSGYGALIAVRRILTERGGSLTMLKQVGQPAALFGLLSDLEAAQQQTSDLHCA